MLVRLPHIPTDNFKKQNIMKTSLILIAIATSVPALMLTGLGGTIAFSIASIIGVTAMFTHDYGRPLACGYDSSKVRVARTERHPFAA